MAANKSTKGFSLLEIMVVMAIVGVLAAFAYPYYLDMVRKSGRADAKVELNEVAQRMHRCFTTTNSYLGACAVVTELANGILSPDEHYEIRLLNASTQSTFTLVARPVAGSRQTKDARCTEFRLTQTGARTALGSTPDECW